MIAENGNHAFETVRLLNYQGKLLAFYNYFPFDAEKGWTIKTAVGFGEVDTETGFIKY